MPPRGSRNWYTGALANDSVYGPTSLSFDELDWVLDYGAWLHDRLAATGHIDQYGNRLSHNEHFNNALVQTDPDGQRFGRWRQRVTEAYRPMIERLSEVVRRINVRDPKHLEALGTELTKHSYMGHRPPAGANPNLTKYWMLKPVPGETALYLRSPEEISQDIHTSVGSGGPVGISSLAGGGTPEHQAGTRAVGYFTDAGKVAKLNKLGTLVSVMSAPGVSTNRKDSVGTIMSRNQVTSQMQPQSHQPGQLGKAISLPLNKSRVKLYDIQRLLEVDPDRALPKLKEFVREEPSCEEIESFDEKDTKALKKAILALYTLKHKLIPIDRFVKGYTVLETTPVDINALPPRRVNDETQRQEDEDKKELMVSTFAAEQVRKYPDAAFIDMLMLRVALDDYVERKRHEPNSTTTL